MTVVTREDRLIAGYSAFAISIYLLESVIPSPFLGVKPGLSNVVVILVLLQYNWRMAIWVSLLRVVVGSLLIGTFLTPTFFLSLSGAVASLVAIGIARYIPNIGPVGYSLLAALAHMAAQFMVAHYLFIPHQGLFYLLPPLMTAAVVFGTFSGLLTASILFHIQQFGQQATNSVKLSNAYKDNI